MNVELKPIFRVPLRERWLFEDPTKIASLRQGIEDARQGRVGILIKTDEEFENLIKNL